MNNTHMMQLLRQLYLRFRIWTLHQRLQKRKQDSGAPLGT